MAKVILKFRYVILLKYERNGMKTIYTSTTIDHETGEVKESTTVKMQKGEEPSYIKLYLQDISYLYGLPATAGDLMHELLQYVTYGTQQIMINSYAKEQICAITGIAKQTLSNRLQDLVNKGIIDRVARGVFVLNPYLFGKGDWNSIRELRNKNLHLKIQYDKTTNSRHITGHIANKE